MACDLAGQPYNGSKFLKDFYNPFEENGLFY